VNEQEWAVYGASQCFADVPPGPPYSECELVRGHSGPHAERPDHEPGEPHQYVVRCTVCGQPGTVQLSIEPQSEPAAALSPERAETPGRSA
jgi:hypothetical protein